MTRTCGAEGESSRRHFLRCSCSPWKIAWTAESVTCLVCDMCSVALLYAPSHSQMILMASHSLSESSRWRKSRRFATKRPISARYSKARPGQGQYTRLDPYNNLDVPSIWWVDDQRVTTSSMSIIASSAESIARESPLNDTLTSSSHCRFCCGLPRTTRTILRS